MIQRISRATVCIMLAGCLTTFTACSTKPSYQEVEIYPTSGSVTVKGEPAYGAVVILHPQGDVGMTKGNRVFAKVKEDGTFAMTTYITEDGAPAGEYLATVIWPLDPNARGPSPDRLRGKYATASQSDLTVMVEEGENQIPPWEL
ncbi:hypothetical protein [Bremerella alba]|uniref:Carboxypeptidase regulatory-like domain-containing protein n=1 Tax=Bremerella alba TaxID=980252 RepID=A0A7V8V4R6_9BACT|nr:hypothetical protein [Bremerella alba]MBA2114927.1 hypothetical protein [Bremerella alba]